MPQDFWDWLGTSPTGDGSELLTPETYVRRSFARLAIGGPTVSGQVTAVSPLTSGGSDLRPQQELARDSAVNDHRPLPLFLALSGPSVITVKSVTPHLRETGRPWRGWNP